MLSTPMPPAVLPLCLLLTLLGPAVASAEMARWTPVAGQSLVSFDASFPPADFSGFGRDITGEFELDASDLGQGVTGHLSVLVSTLSTGSAGRDKDMYKALSAERNPTMFFVVQTVEAPSFPLGVAEHTDTLLTIQGRLSIAGVERVKRFSGRVRLKQGRLWVRGESRFKMSDFGLFRVRDEVGVGFDLLLERRP
jgi:hypothetical protein